MKPHYIPDTNPFTRLIAVGISESEGTILFILNDGRAVPFPFDQDEVNAEDEWHRAVRVDRYADSYSCWTLSSEGCREMFTAPDYRELNISKIFD